MVGKQDLLWKKLEMIESYQKKTPNSEEAFQDILLFVFWAGILCLCSLTLKDYYLAEQPPLWDNLGYQQKALYILTNYLDGNIKIALEILYEENFPGYLFFIAGGFLLFGLNPFSPYLVSAFFGAGCMATVYLLSRELGTNRRMAFWGVIAFSTLPNFIYQNFLQTRNDFPLAFFISASWLLLLRGIKNQNIKLAFYAGIIAGIGTLFKASAPGYVVWGILALLIMPRKYLHINLKDRTKLVLLFIGGAVLSCGWHFLPHLDQILGYYTTWGNAKAWVTTQYNLQNNWTDYFFYIKNIIFIHLGEKVFFGIILIFGALLIKNFSKYRRLKLIVENSKEFPLIFIVALAGLIPLVFISLRESFASVGDIPVLPLLASSSLACIDKFSWRMNFSKGFLFSILPLCLILSISNLSIIEKQFSAKDLNMFSHETMKIRKEFGLGNTPMMQIFSHPIYNVDSLSWLWLMDLNTDRNFVNPPTKKYSFMFPENEKSIALKLNKFPFLIVSNFSGINIQGEKFNTLNRLHSKINFALGQQEQFFKVRSLDLEGGSFPIHFMLNKSFSVLRSTHKTNDDWTKWESEVEYFASKKAKLIWRAVPIRQINSFKLVRKNKSSSFIKMDLNKVLPNGQYEYQSEIVPATSKLVKFLLEPESPGLLLSAAEDDKRKLAFHQVETEVEQYD